jgi:hypothetical protein
MVVGADQVDPFHIDALPWGPSTATQNEAVPQDRDVIFALDEVSTLVSVHPDDNLVDPLEPPLADVLPLSQPATAMALTNATEQTLHLKHLPTIVLHAKTGPTWEPMAAAVRKRCPRDGPGLYDTASSLCCSSVDTMVKE